MYRYGLITEVPDRIWIVVPQNIKTTSSLYRCIRIKKPTAVGVEDKGLYRITSIERTLLEGLRFASKVGIGLALNATRNALKKGKTTETKLYAAATDLKLKKTLEKYWEAIIPS